MKEILEKYGFKFRGICNCAGPKSHKYKAAGDWRVDWNPKTHKFRIRQYGKPITVLMHEADFEGQIIKLGIAEGGIQTVPTR